MPGESRRRHESGQLDAAQHFAVGRVAQYCTVRILQMARNQLPANERRRVEREWALGHDRAPVLPCRLGKIDGDQTISRRGIIGEHEERRANVPDELVDGRGLWRSRA